MAMGRRLAVGAALVAALVVLGAAAATAGAQTITFDDLAGGTLLGAQYSGVTFGVDNTGAADNSAVVFATAAAHSAPNAASAAHPREAGVPFTELWASFGSPQKNVSIYAGDPGDPGTTPQQVSLDLYSGTTLTASASVTVTPGETVDKLLEASAPTTNVTSFHVYDFGAGAHIALDDLSFSAPAPPTAATGAASGVSETSATLNGTINPDGSDVTAYFQYGTDTGYGHDTASQSLTGTSTQNVSAQISGLVPGTTYHYRIVAATTGAPVYGADQSFTTATPPLPTRFTTTEGHAFRAVVAQYPERPSSLSIDWGDKTALDPGRVTPNQSGGYDISAGGVGHTFLTPGTYTATISATFGSVTQTRRVTVTVSDGALNMRVYPETFTAGKSGTTYVATFSDAGQPQGRFGLGSQDESVFTATIDWGDGSSPEAGYASSPDGPGQPWAIYGTHTYASPGQHQMTVTLKDKYGASATGSETVTVVAQPPLAPCQGAYTSGLGPAVDINEWSAPDGSINQSLQFDVPNPAATGRQDIGLTLTASDCWTFDYGTTFSTQAPVTVNGQFVLFPVNAAQPPRLYADTSTGELSAVESAPGAGAMYDIGVVNSDGTLGVFGRTDLSQHPFSLTPSGQADIAVYGRFGESPNSPGIGQNHIVSGQVTISTAGDTFNSAASTITIVGQVPLPAQFHTTVGGGPPPTGTVTFSATPPGSTPDPNVCNTTGGCAGNPGGGYVDPTCYSRPRSCTGPPKLVSADFRRARRTWMHVDTALPTEALGHIPDIQLPGGVVGELLSFTDFDISHDDASGYWFGHAKFDIVPDVLTLEGTINIDPAGHVKFVHIFLSGGAFGVPLWPVPLVELSGFDIGGGVDPTTMVGGISVEVSKIFGVNGHAFVTLASPQQPFPFSDGLSNDLGVSIAYNSPFTSPAYAIGGDGELTLDKLGLEDIKVGGAYALLVDESPGPYFEFGVDISLKPSDYGLPNFVDDLLSLDMKAIGQIGHDPATHRPSFNFDGSLDAHILGIDVNGEGLVSSKGIAACLDVPLSGHVGFGYQWGGSLKVFPPFIGGCGVGDWAAAVSAAGTRTVSFAGGTRFGALQIVGAGHVPNVTLVGPGGRRFTPPAAPSIGRQGNFSWLRSNATHTMYVGVYNAGGAWKIQSAAGSPDVIQVFRSTASPVAKLSAKVTGTGLARKLHYAIARRPGQQVVFAEHGRGANQTIGTVSGGRGVIRFRPEGGPAGPRGIIARITINGIPVGTRTVAHYHAPGPIRAARPTGLRLVRQRSRLQLTWRRARGAARYSVGISLSDGRRLSFKTSARRRSIVVTHVPDYIAAKATVRGLSPAASPGPAASTHIAPAPAPPAPKDLHAISTRRGVIIRWQATHGAVGYHVLLRTGGRTRLVLVKAAHLGPLKSLEPGTRTTIVVRVLSRSGRLGAPATLRYQRSVR